MFGLKWSYCSLNINNVWTEVIIQRPVFQLYSGQEQNQHFNDYIKLYRNEGGIWLANRDNDFWLPLVKNMKSWVGIKY